MSTGRLRRRLSTRIAPWQPRGQMANPTHHAAVAAESTACGSHQPERADRLIRPTRSRQRTYASAIATADSAINTAMAAPLREQHGKRRQQCHIQYAGRDQDDAEGALHAHRQHGLNAEQIGHACHERHQRQTTQYADRRRKRAAVQDPDDERRAGVDRCRHGQHQRALQNDQLSQERERVVTRVMHQVRHVRIGCCSQRLKQTDCGPNQLVTGGKIAGGDTPETILSRTVLVDA